MEYIPKTAQEEATGMVMNGVSEYRINCSQAWNNFENDSNLSEEARSAFVTHLRGFRDGDISGHANHFFDSHNLIGQVVNLDNNEVLGHIMTPSIFKHLIHKGLERQITGPSLKGIAAITGHLVPTNDEKLKALKMLLGNTRLSRYNESSGRHGIMWSFRNELDTNEPFNNRIPRTDMPCVLGLKDTRPTFYCVEYKLSHEVHLPTVFDARNNNAWRPGGRTLPLDECGNRYPTGLLEVVHEPATFNDLERPMEVIE
jgi:hypothetical protein